MLKSVNSIYNLKSTICNLTSLPQSAISRSLSFLHSAIQLFERLSNLHFPPFVRSHFQLASELGTRQPQRLERAHFFRIAYGLRVDLSALAFELLHSFLNSRIGIDESLAGITHNPHIIR
jgi:hypothetical protein